MELKDLKMQFEYMDPDHRESVEAAVKRGIHIPSYLFEGVANDGTEIKRECHFTPAQLMVVTEAPYEHALSESNCRHLVSIWNNSSSGRYTYTYLG
jgi:hypothetical protein